MAERIPDRRYLCHEEVGIANFIGLLEPAKRLIQVAQRGLNLCQIAGRNIGGFLLLLEFRALLLEESLEQTRLGRSYDPLSPLSHQVVLYHALMAGHYDEVIVEGRQLIERFPGSRAGHSAIGQALWALGRYEEALAEIEMSWGAESERFLVFKEAFERLGPTGAQKALADWLVETEDTQTVNVLRIAGYYAWAGENDAAFEWLEKAFDARSALLLHAPFHPYFDPIRSDPRFAALMQRVGIPGAAESGTR